MKTERIYYDEPDRLEFDANVVDTLDLETRVGVILDRTAFYPTSGGQPNDIGVLGGIDLIDCYEDEESGNIIHVLTKKPQGARVHGQVDADRRIDHTQQHSGQHVLSRAFVDLFNWPTVSFHLGTETCTIDLGIDAISRDQLDQAEALANRIVREDHAVAIRYLNQQNIGDAGLRKPTDRAGDIRVIDIAGFDRSACGGTHVRTTREIGPILITGMSRAKRQTRVEFICGNRVLSHARLAHRALEAIGRTISSPLFETPEAVTTVWRDLQESRKRIADLESRLLDYEAAGFSAVDGVVKGVFVGRGIDTLKQLALRIASRPKTIVLFADQDDQLRVVLARSADSTIDVSAVLKETMGQFGGRGGGRPDFAQAGGLSAASAETVIQFAEKLVRFREGET